MHIGDTVNVKDQFGWEDVFPYWKGKVTEIRDSGRIITVQDKGINFAEIDIDDLVFKDGEYWEKWFSKRKWRTQNESNKKI